MEYPQEPVTKDIDITRTRKERDEAQKRYDNLRERADAADRRAEDKEAARHAAVEALNLADKKNEELQKQLDRVTQVCREANRRADEYYRRLQECAPGIAACYIPPGDGRCKPQEYAPGTFAAPHDPGQKAPGIPVTALLELILQELQQE